MAITDIYTLADDALQNMFNVSLISYPSVLSSYIPTTLQDALGLRVTEFNKPEIGVDTYEVHYKGLKVPKPVNKTNFSNEFSFTIRLDRDYLWYQMFEAWNRLLLDTTTGVLGPDYGDLSGGLGSTHNRGTLRIYPDFNSGSASAGKGWTFYGCAPKLVPSISYSQESGEMITVEITWMCNQMTPMM